MPQFLTTSGTSYYIEEIIIKAKAELVLITPYLKLSRILFERLADANARGVRIRVVYGKSELHPRERRQLDALANVELLFLANLHAKCYFNDSTLIVSSMNLYEFSEKNNREMGIVLTRGADGDCFADALAEAHSILHAAQGTAQAAAVAPRVTPLAPPVDSFPSPQGRGFDLAGMVEKVHELAKQHPVLGPSCALETASGHLQPGRLESIMSAWNFPQPGIHLRFSGEIQFEFTRSGDYKEVKTCRRSAIEEALAGGYRCYWRPNLIRVCAAKSYEWGDEDAAAQYFLQAIEKVSSVLEAFPLPTSPRSQ